MDSSNTEPQKRFSFVLPFPKLFTLCCIGVTFGRSKKKDDGSGDNPMFTRRFEVVSPETVNVKNDEGNFVLTSIQGLEVTDYLTLSSKTKEIVKRDCERFQVDIPDDETPNVLAYVNKTAKATLITDRNVMKDVDTGEPILDSKGQPVIFYRHTIKQWID